MMIEREILKGSFARRGLGGDDEAALRRDGEGKRSAPGETPEAAALALRPEMGERVVVVAPFFFLLAFPFLCRGQVNFGSFVAQNWILCLCMSCVRRRRLDSLAEKI